MSFDYIKAIDEAKVYDVAIKTPLTAAPKLSKRLNNDVVFKREDLQPVFSFKLRGAYNKIANLSQEDKDKGVICASAGNHAQGVAMSAAKLGIAATIVMPETTPDIKVSAVEAMGGNVVLIGDSYSDASAHAKVLCDENGYTFIHPYDNELVIAGQGTVAKELIKQSKRPIDAVFIPIGGGGLAAGIAAYFKAKSPQTKLIGVEPVDSAAMFESIKADKLVTLDQVGIFADGVAVKQVGDITFDLCKQYLDEVILVDTDETCAAIKDIYDEIRAIVEPAGALALAALKKYVKREAVNKQTLVAINSGANMNFDRLRHVSERAELGERREALFTVQIPERAGSFLEFCNQLGAYNVTEFNYRMSSRHEAYVYVGVAIKHGSQAEKITTELREHGYQITSLMDNEAAKLHLRHLVGGKSVDVHDEHLYRFEFPERPRALLDFLTKLAGRWNISLFHYRNHGAAFGRVLVGFEVPDKDLNTFQAFLEDVGYTYVDESNNEALKLFL
ncbi:threonine ammonia-lyase, biosynthetic [Ghiorsea bivora]|uniref:threonine ammonia-lyase, biosynthetic n=1 Tax=Ghiorsea bivora TaxID=1485545 RepID=UPI00056FAD98|nr:threonine ammonia-lyase, biosynthetic [Ghiorsea bivora]